MHLNLADQRAFGRLSSVDGLSDVARELLRSTDLHARALITRALIAGVLPDFERDLDAAVLAQTGALRFVLIGQLMITARLHPVCAADVIVGTQRVAAACNLRDRIFRDEHRGMLWLEEAGGTIEASLIIGAVALAVFLWLCTRGFLKV